MRRGDTSMALKQAVQGLPLVNEIFVSLLPVMRCPLQYEQTQSV